MAYIGSFPADKTSGAKPRDEFTGDGSTVNFTLSQEVPGGFESNVLVIVDNVIQQPVESYTIGGDNLTLQFSEAPAASAVVYVLHQGNATYQMIPVVGSVTPDKLSENLRNFTVDTFTGDGSTVAYTLTATPASANSILVIVDGIVQTKTTNYTLSSTTLTFTDAPDSSAAITVIHLGFSTVSRTAVPDGSITTAKIADNAITSAKLGFDVIVAEDIAANAITVAEIANGAVTPAKLSTGGLYWDTSSNIGIGTSSPSTQLQVNSGATTYSDQLRIRNTNYGNADIGVGNGIMALATDMSNIAFYTSSSLGTTGSTVPSNERMRIDSAGKVGIGTNAPSYSFEVVRNANDSLTRLNAQNPNAGSSAVTILGMGNDQTSTGAGLKLGSSTWSSGANTVEVFNNLNGSIFFSTQGTERIRIPSDAGGIKFPATQAASSDANTLDDYEEGTFTPSLLCDSGSVSGYTNQVGYYRKIGSMVTIWFYVRATSISGNLVRISGLPFSVTSNGTGYQPITRDSAVTLSLETYLGTSGQAFFDTTTNSYLSAANAQSRGIGGVYTYIAA
jgi:hypothetical protein